MTWSWVDAGWTLGSSADENEDLFADANSFPTVHRLFAVADPSPLPSDDQYGLNADFNISQVVVVHKYISHSIYSMITIYMIQKDPWDKLELRWKCILAMHVR